MKANVQDEGSIILFRPLDQEAEEWCDKNLDPDRQSFGQAIVIEPRYIVDILCAFVNDGGEME